MKDNYRSEHRRRWIWECFVGGNRLKTIHERKSITNCRHPKNEPDWLNHERKRKIPKTTTYDPNHSSLEHLCTFSHVSNVPFPLNSHNSKKQRKTAINSRPCYWHRKNTIDWHWESEAVQSTESNTFIFVKKIRSSHRFCKFEKWATQRIGEYWKMRSESY